MIVLHSEAIIYGKIHRFNKWAGPTMIRSILAGVYIALGGLFMGLLKLEGYPKLLYSAGFSIGLFLVVMANGELFTGNCLVKPFVEEDDAALKSSEMLLFNYIGNIIGALIVFILVKNISSIDSTVFSEIAKAKCSPDISIIELLLKGFFCNVLVCLAVWIAAYSGYCESGISMFIALLLPVSMFIFCGFEHSIANAFFLPFGFVDGDISIYQLFGNLAFVTLGNWFGGRIVGFCLHETVIGDKIDFIQNHRLDDCNDSSDCCDCSNSEDSV